MKRWIAMLAVAALLGGTVGYVTYAKACEANGGKCCGECPVDTK